ncbi:MAG: tRNA lysidine(34) synthetase TilS [Methylobacterium mesophilicum]|nr:tRNA lysidine(34) synthetase TilS [Methylobacterium mesophilicum]
MLTRSPADTHERGRLDPDALFRPFTIPPGASLIAAVSGGSDSVALLHCLHAVSRKRNWRVHVATVDHGLRAESAAEARGVGAVAARLGLPHRVLRWEGEKPMTGIQAAARAARYELLNAYARETGAGFLFTGHTEDDQTETVRMRAERGSGRGLAGMAPATLLGGEVWLLRPLLETRRADLRSWLRSENIGWTEDPSNNDPRFERVRVRADENADRNCILSLRAEAEARRIGLGRAAAAIVAACADLPSPGLVRLGTEGFASGEAGLYAFRALLACVGGREHFPDPARSAALWQRLAAGPLRASFGGAVIERRKGSVFLHREARGIATSPAGRGNVFDGRFRANVSAPGTVVPAGEALARQAFAPATGLPPRLALGALAVLPALQEEGAAAFFPADGRFEPVVSPFARLLSCFDHPLAQSLARLLGARDFPLPP